ncbi:MAG TPA: hypothetical protein VGD98_11220 [Ktedonobacteraceae bacterium]
MVCPSCRAGCAVEDIFCRRCGTDLSVPSKSLVSVQTQVPTRWTNSALPQVAAGVGAVAVGVGLELLRRGLLARMTHSARRSAQLMPALTPNHLRELLPQKESRAAKLPKGYEIQETVIYIGRIMRRN